MFRSVSDRRSRNDSISGRSLDQPAVQTLDTGLQSPLQLAASPKTEANYRKRFPDSLRFKPGSLRRHSRALSSSTVSSALVLDSDTTCSISTVASPASSSYTNETFDIVETPCTDKPESWHLKHAQSCLPHPSGSTESTEYDTDDDGVPRFVHLGLTTPEAISSLDICAESEFDRVGESDSPMTEKRLSQTDNFLAHDADASQSEDSVASPKAQSWDTASEATEEAADVDVDAETLLNYTLQLVYGVEIPERRPELANLRRLSAKFIEEIGEEICQAASSDEHQSQTMNTFAAPETERRNSDTSNGKRKKDEKDSDDPDEYGSGQGSGSLPVKKAKPNPRDEENLRLSCPFRKRNPHRFNVRDHHSCAMTYFPKFSELRQHIVRQHKRDDPSAFVCDRCNCDFQTRKELRDHQRQPKHLMCDIADHDPESGVDGPTCNKLLSRKRASGTSAQIQWKEIWNLLFPDDDDSDIRPFCFIPVIEHFELVSQFSASFDCLRSSLRDKISNPATLETLSTIFHQCFVETVDNCLNTAQDLPYVNRSNKRNDGGKSHGVSQIAFRNLKRTGQPQSRPDSGVVLDDGSEEGSSVTDSGLRHSDSVTTLRTTDGLGTPVLKDTPGSSVLSVPPSYPDIPTADTLPAHSLAVPMEVAMEVSMTPAGDRFIPAVGFTQGVDMRAWNDNLLYDMISGNITPAEQMQHETGQWAGQSTQYVAFPETRDQDVIQYHL